MTPDQNQKLQDLKDHLTQVREGCAALISELKPAAEAKNIAAERNVAALALGMRSIDTALQAMNGIY